MRKISNIKRSVRAVSPVISTLLMISIVVIASLVAYVFVVGFVGGKTEYAGNGIQVQSLASRSNLVVYVQNTGQGIVHLREHGSIYVNDFSMNILRVDDKTIQEVMDQKGLIPIKVGQTIAVTVNYLPQPEEQLRIKIVTVEGTSMQSSGKPHFSFSMQVPVTFITNPIGAGTIDQQSQDYPVGAIIPITATANPGYVFASWTYTGYIEINNPASASTDAQIIGSTTVTAIFLSAEDPTTPTNPCPTTSPTPTPTTSPTTNPTPSPTPTSTPTTTPHPSPSPHPTQPPCPTPTPTTTPTPTPTTTPKPSTEHNSHFDDNSEHWNHGWDYWTHSPWKVTTDKCYDIHQSVKSTSSNQGHFTCNPIDASDAKYITITFKYMTHQTQPTNFHARYSGSVTEDYCNVAWKTLGEHGANLGDNSKYSQDQWNEYKITITDISAFTNNFRLSFLSQDLNSRAAIWIDNVQITICK
jgi:hypothetical protein